ncbi:MAG TPA: hypothetical protein VKV17_21340 [Bryobacteraceae bacterium]|nr:hypothetical protein [Bryobacteraceae bacterium]
MQPPDHRLKRLAETIEGLAAKDRQVLDRTRQIAEFRRKAAVEIHGACAEFVLSLNRLLSQPQVVLDPPVFLPESFRESGQNLLQINVRGRILQIDFSATAELVSTEEFRLPYILEGTVRAFNQQFLEKDIIEEQLIFYTLEKEKNLWRYFDPRTYRSGPFGQEYLVSLMERLV